MLVCPGLINLKAASLALYAARITSALAPVTGSLSDLTTKLWPTNAGNPSIWTPNSILTRSPSLIEVESSGSGELWAHI